MTITQPEPDYTPLELLGTVAIEPRISDMNTIDIAYGMNRPANAFDVEAARTVTDIRLVEDTATILTSVSPPSGARINALHVASELKQVNIEADNLRNRRVKAIQAVQDSLQGIKFN